MCTISAEALQLTQAGIVKSEGWSVIGKQQGASFGGTPRRDNRNLHSEVESVFWLCSVQRHCSGGMT